MFRKIVFLLFLLSSWAFSQEESDKTEDKFLSFGFRGGAGTLGYSYVGDAGIGVDQSVSFRLGMFFDFNFNKWLGVDIGASGFFFNQNLALDNYSNSIPQIDNEGDRYELRVSASGVQEANKSFIIDLPIALKLKYTWGRGVVYTKFGVSYQIPYSLKYEQSGKYTVNGFYEDYNLLIDEYALYNFYTDQELEVYDADFELNAEFNPFLGLGVVFPGKKERFFIELIYYPGLVDFSVVDENRLLLQGERSTDGINLGSFVENPEGVNLKGFMVELGVLF